ncbi:S9 family peptidase [Macrococcoides caseolyticum]|uniref:S9 family peptidase n=1 Tax=Macrococcoides caseolyticum TaxID=69966 RepID=UPI001F21CF2D|nr:S9 family peptidase [Macrococcus caseolyticus]MCE4955683.1 glycosyl transferase [Macrococcus caseolyticus]
MLTLNYEELENYTFENGFNTDFAVNFENKTYYFHLKYNEKYDNIICFSNGAIDPSKKQPPLFQRSSWKSEFRATCLFIDDPTLHNNGLKIGWGQGSIESFALEKIAQIIDKLMISLNYSKEKVTFYGSSAGGYMSIYLATLLKGTKVIVNNPQTYVLNYHESAVNKLLEIIYPNLTLDEVKEKYAYRLSLTQAFSKFKNTPKMLYMQNRACVSDMKGHADPFMKNIAKYKGIKDVNIEFYFYKHPKEGHNPLPKDQTIKMIHHFID